MEPRKLARVERNPEGKEVFVFGCLKCDGACNKTRGDRFTYEEFKLLAPTLKLIQSNREGGSCG